MGPPGKGPPDTACRPRAPSGARARAARGPRWPATGPSNNNNGTAEADEGLSLGAKAGIDAGMGAAVLAAALGFLLFWRRRRAATGRNKDVADGAADGTGAEAGEQLVGGGHDCSQNGQAAVEKD
ncbi:hypothetical protein GGTG_12135 [Gaeumannomyces tritici R3-111a-1]|uniref:Uncharacterized protein n=1 Tax=Gaeumannomyces tritici (strain R3-111a-1) TaxID=644352 RepID=J3PF56_GAET3|nr:hypothetical protein GGTG_12135 [Gaeumannomyces tritici R3-111a-1]EJT69958.1 hypothetical protein GGTG_12135 [Gaeumannomyces tritici R3-111a-1]